MSHIHGGISLSPNKLVWQHVVDWNNDGDFGDKEEDVTTMVAAKPGLTVEIGLDSARTLSPPRINRASSELKNADQTFSAEFPGSPIYQQMLPSRAVEHRVTLGGDINYDSEFYYEDDVLYNGSFQKTVFTGLIESMPQHPELVLRRVALSAIGTLTKLRGQRQDRRKISTALYESITTGTAIGHILDAIGWPADKRAIDAGSTTLVYWWLDEEEPYKAVLDLLAVEGPQAAFYEDGAGVLHWEGRNYRGITSRSLISQATFYDESGSGTEALYESSELEYESDMLYESGIGVYHIRPFQYDQGFRNVINSCIFETVQRSLQPLAVVWTYSGATITLGGGESKTVRAKPSDPFKAAVCTNGVDVTASSGSISSVSISRTSGGNTDITITAGGGGATINLLQLRAQAATVASTTSVISTEDAAASIATYDQQDYKIDARKEIDVNTALDIANAIVARYKDPQPSVSITLSNHNFSHSYEQFYRQISDRITIYENHTGVQWDAHINQIVHRALEGGLIHYTTFHCEKAPPSSVALAYVWDDASSVWGTATWGA